MKSNPRLIWFLVPVLILVLVIVAITVRSGHRKLEGIPVQVAWHFSVDGATNARIQDYDPEGCLLMGVGGTITRLSADGELLAQFPDPSQEGAGQLLFGPGGLIYCTTHSGEVYCLDSDGNLLWSVMLPGKFGQLNTLQQNECHGGMIAVRSDGSLFAVSGSGDACVITPDGEVVDGFHAPYHFYHSTPMVLLNDSVAAIQDSEDTVYVYTTTGQLLATARCDFLGGEFIVRRDGVLLVAGGEGVITAIGADGKELWTSDKYLPAVSLMPFHSLWCLRALDDNRVVVVTDQRVLLLSDQGKVLWRKQLPGDFDECFVNDDRWIDLVVREGGGSFDFFKFNDFSAYLERPRCIIRWDLEGDEQSCWELPQGSWDVYGPGPEQEYYVYMDAPRSADSNLRYSPVDLMRLVLP